MKPSLLITGMQFHGFHGCLEEEARAGNDYTVNVEMDADLSTACLNDTLSDTIDYVAVHTIVQEQMNIRSKLIEHVGMRILKALYSAFPGVEEIRVEVTKHRPPVNGSRIGGATVRLSSRDISK